MRRILPLLLTLLLLGTACQPFEPRPYESLVKAPRWETRSLDSQEFQEFFESLQPGRAGEWPPADWSLDQLTIAALYFNPKLAIAQAQWLSARAAIETAGERPNPSVTFGPGYDFNPAKGVSPWIGNLNLDIPIETAGKRGARMDRSRHLAEAARMRFLEAVWQARSTLRTALIEFSAARQKASILENQINTQTEIVSLMEARLKLGAVASVEAHTARIALTRAHAEAADVARAASEAKVRLAEAIGLPLEALDRVRLAPLPRYPIPNEISQLRSLALHGRADILAALSNYEASQSALRLEIARQYPDVRLGSGYVWDQGEHKWSLGLTIDLPVMNRNQGAISEALAHRREAAGEVLAAQGRVISEIDRARAAVASTEKHREELKKVRDQLDANLTLAEQRWKQGAADRIDFLTARSERDAAAAALADVEWKAAQAASQLEEAVQAPLLWIPGGLEHPVFSKVTDNP